jgi:ATP-dependent Clp endopeptidase proteolytic subunit ClpP
MNNLIHIENRSGKISLNDIVHKDSADKLLDELSKLYGQKAVDAKMQLGEVVCVADNALESVEVEINSPGGSVIEGQRIYNGLREMSNRGVNIKTSVNGLAASMGSVILMAGDERTMTKGSRIMIHEASTISWGDARTMKRNYDLLEGMSNEIAGIYAERTGGDKESIRNMMYSETWMDADKAKELGFVNSIIDYDIDRKKEMKDKSRMSILARLFPDNDQVAQLEAQVAENDSLRAEITDLKAQLDSFGGVSAELIEARLKVDEITNERDTAKDELATAIAKITELESKVVEVTASVSDQTIEALASIGQTQAIVIEGEPVNHIEALKTLTGKARTEYYNKYKTEIRSQQ